ncbi:MAG TPA: TonB family protein [Longimicrobiales bacterium]|nr:TonB family protein [Longimicrobiales bacterium]
MSAARAVPAEPSVPSANERLKAGFRTLLGSAVILATLVHFGVFVLWPEMTFQDYAFASDELVSVELPPEIEIPPPPSEIVRPAAPVIATADIPDDVTIAPTTFEMNPVSELPPPPAPEARVQPDSEGGPRFTPYTVAPQILNRDEIARALVELYPPLLRNAGIGGTVQVFISIDENGVVQDYQIHKSSGYRELDEAALQVAELYRFSPALNRDKRVPVWLLFPIEFQVR